MELTLVPVTKDPIADPARKTPVPIPQPEPLWTVSSYQATHDRDQGANDRESSLPAGTAPGEGMRYEPGDARHLGFAPAGTNPPEGIPAVRKQRSNQDACPDHRCAEANRPLLSTTQTISA